MTIINVFLSQAQMHFQKKKSIKNSSTQNFVSKASLAPCYEAMFNSLGVPNFMASDVLTRFWLMNSTVSVTDIRHEPVASVKVATALAVARLNVDDIFRPHTCAHAHSPHHLRFGTYVNMHILYVLLSPHEGWSAHKTHFQRTKSGIVT